MILKASQRGGGQDLAAHLMRADENEHVSLHELRGFMADDLKGAFKEADAVSRGTKCRQFLFSLSLSPPEQERVPAEVFEKAIDRIEERLGLEGQPRAIVFHEKEGRRHAHCVWSRNRTATANYTAARARPDQAPVRPSQLPAPCGDKRLLPGCACRTPLPVRELGR